jgi:hypothetical protein
MFEATETKHAPWRLIRSDDKRRARLNVISHILETIPYKKIARERSSCRSDPAKAAATIRPAFAG